MQKEEVSYAVCVILLLTNSLMFTLRLNGSTGSFPKPLSAAEEKQYLERYAAGDLEGPQCAH